MVASLAAAEIRSISITEQVAANLKARILRGELPPGQRLVEQQLARSLGVGQNAIREALIDLAHRGFVRRVANRATHVTSLSLAEATKLAEVRGALESLALDLIARRIRSDAAAVDLGPLDSLLKRMRRAAKAGDREAFYEADLAWHREVWRLSANEYLTQTLEQIVTPLFAFFIMLYMRRDHNAKSFLKAAAAHERVIECLRSPKPAAAAAAMRAVVDLSLRDQEGLISGHEED